MGWLKTTDGQLGALEASYRPESVGNGLIRRNQARKRAKRDFGEDW